MRKKEIRLILSCCAVSIAAIMVAFTAYAATLNVPGDYGSIQGAIDNANPAGGDTVLCQPGAYTPVNFNGTPVTVECAVPRECIIDCSIDGPSSHGVAFENSEGSNSVLTGFKIMNAANAAILCNGSSPTITDCNMWDNNNSVCGAIEAYDSSPTINNCDLSHNTFTVFGGACFFGGSPTISNSDFYRNVGDWAGGIHFVDSSPTLSGCNITYNSASFDDPETAGGAVFFGGSPTITGGSIS
ncbi:MAG: right-handed parallel beta-helix repeat-containing protein [Deltaproteobacteria bacterium]|nr:right-handed parallel beta-helix repeat-containing protein [Deltaproteobacteria bacterium]